MNAHDTRTQTKESDKITYNGRSDRWFKLLVLLAVVTLLATVVLTVVYLLSMRFGFTLITATPFSQWIDSDRLVIGVIGVCLLASLQFTLLARQRIKRSRSHAITNGCPACGEHRLIRIHRHRNERLLATIFRLPLRRYVCETCQWKGVMVYTPAIINLEISEATRTASSSAMNKADAVTPHSNQAQSPSDINYQSVDKALTISGNGFDSAGEKIIYTTKAVVSAPFGLSLRSAPHNTADILLTLESETVVTLVDPLDEDSPAAWRKVAVGDQVGWVSTAFLRYLG